MAEISKVLKGVSFTDSLKNYLAIGNVSLCQFLYFLNIADIAQQIENNFYSDKDWHFRYDVSAMIKFAVVKFFWCRVPKYAPPNIMQIIKSITAKIIFKKYPDIKKQLWGGGEFWSDGGYIATVGDGITVDIIKSYVEKQGTKEEKEGYSQMKLLDYE